ncbi:MAG: DUF3788 domain-containing protein [Chloroflexota bacterium]
MSIGLFVDKAHPPTQQEVHDALGSRLPLWQQLLQFVADNYQLPDDLSFGGKKYGWNIWYRKGGKTLASLYPQKDYFVAQVVLGKEQVEKAFQLQLGKNVRTALEETPQFHDGRWLFIQVRSEEDVRDVQELLRIKRRPRPLQR